MERRTFIGTLAGGLLAAPLAAKAQSARRVWQVGLLDYGSPDAARLAWWRAFQDKLRELGYVEGQTVVFHPRWGNGQVSRLQGLASELVAAKVDILVTAGHPAALAAKQATSAIPIVTANGPDPVELGTRGDLGAARRKRHGYDLDIQRVVRKTTGTAQRADSSRVQNGRPLGSCRSRVCAQCTRHGGCGSIPGDRAAECRRASRS